VDRRSALRVSGFVAALFLVLTVGVAAQAGSLGFGSDAAPAGLSASSASSGPSRLESPGDAVRSYAGDDDDHEDDDHGGGRTPVRPRGGDDRQNHDHDDHDED
jgi:hypothetical protein